MALCTTTVRGISKQPPHNDRLLSHTVPFDFSRFAPSGHVSAHHIYIYLQFFTQDTQDRRANIIYSRRRLQFDIPGTGSLGKC